MANFSIRMEGCIAECGEKTKWMGKVYFIIATVSRLMMGSGKQTAFMGKGFFTTKTFRRVDHHLIIKTLISWVAYGSAIKDSFFRTSS